MDFILPPFDSLTITRQDYVPKKFSKRCTDYATKQEFKDPIVEAYKEFLILEGSQENQKAPIETLDNYYERFKSEHPVICKLQIPNAVDKHVIEINHNNNGRSIYQFDYCDLDKAKEYLARELEKKNFRLPPDWEDPPTTYLSSYRHRKKSYFSKPVLPVENLTMNENERNYSVTGLTEYQRTIGCTGKEVIKCQMYGKRVNRVNKPLNCITE